MCIRDRVKEMEKETPEAAPVQEKEEDDVFKIRPTEFKSKINVVGQIDLAAYLSLLSLSVFLPSISFSDG